MYLFHSREMQGFPFRSAACATSCRQRKTGGNQPLSECQDPSDKLNAKGSPGHALGKIANTGEMISSHNPPDVTLCIITLCRAERTVHSGL